MKFEVLRHKYYKRYLWERWRKGKKVSFYRFLLFHRKHLGHKHNDTAIADQGKEISRLHDNFNYLSCAGMDETSIRLLNADKRKKTRK